MENLSSINQTSKVAFGQTPETKNEELNPGTKKLFEVREEEKLANVSGNNTAPEAAGTIAVNQTAETAGTVAAATTAGGSTGFSTLC